jgi:hypothetical protein
MTLSGTESSANVAPKPGKNQNAESVTTAQAGAV